MFAGWELVNLQEIAVWAAVACERREPEAEFTVRVGMLRLRRVVLSTTLLRSA